MSTSPIIIDFYFDFSSPYAYLAAMKADDFEAEHGVTLSMKPYLMGAVFKEEGNKPLLEYPRKGAYTRLDLVRSAAEIGQTITIPTPFPTASVVACRVFYALEAAKNALAARRFAQAALSGYFTNGLNPNDAEAMLGLAAKQGHDAAMLAQAIASDEIKGKLRQVTDEALQRGVFGAPFFFLGDEPFWGFDRMPMLGRAIARQRQT